MKKIALLVIVLIASTSSTFAYYNRVTENGGLFGYSYTSKEVSGSGDVDISCKNPGFSSCPTIVNCENCGENQEYKIKIVKDIFRLIESGVLKGKIIENGFIGVWQSSDIEMTNSSIHVTNF